MAETPACKTLFRSGTEDFPLAIFEKRDRSGNKISIVSLTKCPPPGDEKYNSEALKKVFADNYGKWNAVVLDVRGNEGGNADVINFVAALLSPTGNANHTGGKNPAGAEI